MWDWLKAAHAVHLLVVVLGAIGFFHFWMRTRFWFPRYVHYLAGLGLALGVACLGLMPPEAPINQGQWAGLKKALLLLVFPGLVYFFFVFYGGQRAAYERTHGAPARRCPYCRARPAGAGGRCASCGQVIEEPR